MPYLQEKVMLEREELDNNLTFCRNVISNAVILFL